MYQSRCIPFALFLLADGGFRGRGRLLRRADGGFRGRGRLPDVPMTVSAVAEGFPDVPMVACEGSRGSLYPALLSRFQDGILAEPT